MLSRSRLYSGATSSATACGFLEVGELICAEPAVQSPEAARPSVQGEEKSADGQSKSLGRVPVRKQRGPRIGWVSVVNDSGKTMLQSVSDLSKIGNAWGGSDGADTVGSLNGVGNGKHCTEAERLFSIELLQGRLQDDALALTASMSARMTAFRELIDNKEAELLAEIQGAVDHQSAQLQQTKQLCSTSRRVELPPSALDPGRFLAEVDACLQQVSALRVVKSSAVSTCRHPVEIAPAIASASPVSELPRDLRQLRATKPNETPLQESSTRRFRQSLSENQNGADIRSSPAAAAVAMDASLDLRGELSESPSPSPVAKTSRTRDEASTPQQPSSSRQMPMESSPSASDTPKRINPKGIGSATTGCTQHHPPGARLINMPIASGSAGATRKIETPSKKRRMEAFRKSSSSAINA